MSLIKKCPFFLLLVVSGLLLTFAGMMGRNSIYKEISLDLIKAPYLSLVMKGMGDGILPWEAPVYAVMAEKAAQVNEQVEGADLDEILLGVNQSEQGNLTENMIPEIPSKPAGEKGAADIEIPKVPVDSQASSQEIVQEQVSEDITYAYQQVTEDYFNDALFIGDSRTVGMFEYGGLEERADFFAKTSLTIYSVLDAVVVQDKVSGEKMTVDAALQEKQYGKIYFMLGINEMGTGTTETFMKQYSDVVARIRQLQPEAVIFIQSIMRVTQEKSDNDPVFNNPNINERNDAISKLEDQKNIFYIDVNEVVVDDKGGLNTEYTGDGVHLKAAYYQLWKDLLLQKGIVRE